jgi:hypothetical protein
VLRARSHEVVCDQVVRGRDIALAGPIAFVRLRDIGLHIVGSAEGGHHAEQIQTDVILVGQTVDDGRFGSHLPIFSVAAKPA